VDELFQRFRILYSANWMNGIEPEDHIVMLEMWTETLEPFTAYQLGSAYKKIKNGDTAYNEFPPTLPGFVELCKQFPRQEPKPVCEERIYSKQENRFWWRSFTDSQKTTLFQEACIKFPFLIGHIADKNKERHHLDIEFPTHFSFDIMMEVLGRPFRKAFTGEKDSNKASDFSKAASMFPNSIYTRVQT
jgi:hypothetical protein